MKRLFVSLFVLGACATEQAATKESAPPPAEKAEAPKQEEPKKVVIDASKPMPPGLDEAAMDTKADPCTDFYQYACGGWMSATQIPADRPLYSRGFVAIGDRNEASLKGILDEAVANKLPAGTPFAKQLGDYYGSCMDEAKLEQALPEVKKFVDAATSAPLPIAIAKLHAVGFRPFFDLAAQQDAKSSTEVILALDQNGLGLPDRDYYLEADAKKQQIRDNYLKFTETMFTLYGEKPEVAKKTAEALLALETRLAKASQSRVERRDPNKLYNRVERKGLKEAAKDFDWDGYLKAVGAKDVTAITVNSVAYFTELGALAKELKPEVWKKYLAWVVMRTTVPALPKKFQDEQFAFVAKNFTGATEDRPRWKKCVAFTDIGLGEALGREFARRYFPEESKQRTLAMVQALQKSFEADLPTLGWMDEATRSAAKTKVGRMVGNNKIGYPDKWRDYATVKTTRNSFFANGIEALRFETERQLAKVGKPVDRGEWLMSPPAVNAYYEPQLNEIVFPAGILQPPFFDKDATDAVNFGSMGMVVGHEITHGFDDEGRQFDADGNLKDWWSPSAGKNFVEKASCVKDQFSSYTAIDDIKVKGDLTLGENVADLGGLKLAHAAMVDWYVKKGGDDAFRFNRSQQFFLGFAQSWCTKVRPEMARLRAATDPHAPPFLRVLGPLSNNDAFKSAFMCTDTSKMVRGGAQRCTVW